MSGLVLVDKPVGLGSRDVGKKVARHLGYRKFGHVGTLDPLATGILIVLLGEATKLSQFLVSADKRYLATIRLGLETDSYDIDGQVIAQVENLPVSEEQVCTAIAGFAGTQMQVPPPISAVKIDGVAAHKRVRAGEDVSLAAREITMHSIEIESITLPDVQVLVHCTKGTYLRSLAHDLGAELGTGGCIAALRRTESPPFHVMHASPLEQILALEPTQAKTLLVPLERALPDWIRHEVPAGSVLDKRLQVGNQPSGTELAPLLAAGFDTGQKFMLVGSQRIALMEAEVPAVSARSHTAPLRYLRVLERS